ncbi:hypothetical protein [Sulfurospirillum sp.]|uniref:hypothetical protein n=1 Tax=Sulfurospirillum sp. TaxID=2053622 RepID=UPI002FDC9542
MSTVAYLWLSEVAKDLLTLGMSVNKKRVTRLILIAKLFGVMAFLLNLSAKTSL